MKTVTTYYCEVCDTSFHTAEAAMKCESRPSPPEYPVGMMYGDHRPGTFYEGITFAVARNRIDGHLNWRNAWACRDNGAGDSLGEQVCVADITTLGEHDGHLDPDHPTFKRMVAYLETLDLSSGIQVWNGQQAIPLDQYMRHAARQQKGGD